MKTRLIVSLSICAAVLPLFISQPAHADSTLKEYPKELTEKFESSQRGKIAPFQQATNWINETPTWGTEDGNTSAGELFAYGGYLYAGFWNINGTGTEMWRYDGTTWTQINTDGFGDATNFGIYSMTVYNGALVAGTGNSSGAELWKYENGLWQVFSATTPDNGLGDANNTYIDVLTLYNGNLYAGTYNTTTGSEIWMYNGTTWSQVNTNGFGDALSTDTYALTVYGSYLYAGVSNSTSGGKVFRFDGGTSWTQVNTNGFGDVSTTTIYEMVEFDGYLYASADYEVWRYNGTTWSQVGTDSFGDPANLWVEDLLEYHGKLYASSADINGGQIWQWNGTTWTRVGTGGLGNTESIMLPALAEFNGRLYCGTSTFLYFTPAEIRSWYDVDTLPVYRFWNTTSHHHFYTISESEKNMIIATWPSWRYEGIAFTASPTQTIGLVPVYRFWSAQNHAHFFTIDEAEKDYVIAHYTDSQWLYEGVAYYATPTGDDDMVPVYRFWSAQNHGHFFTTNQSERDYVIDNYSDSEWLYEGVAYYIFP